jgi:hypothetical protein
MCIGAPFDVVRFSSENDLACKKSPGFSGYRYRVVVEGRTITVILFASGKAVFTGLKAEEDERLCRLIIPDLLRYTTEVPSGSTILPPTKTKAVKKVKLPKILQVLKPKKKKQKKHAQGTKN